MNGSKAQIIKERRKKILEPRKYSWVDANPSHGDAKNENATQIRVTATQKMKKLTQIRGHETHKLGHETNSGVSKEDADDFNPNPSYSIPTNPHSSSK